MNLPSIDNLLCFEAAARLLNFRAAAKVVCLTPAAVGQRIKQLEEQLGVVLFQRTHRAVRLTDAGHALLPLARRCIESAEACMAGLAGGGGPPAQEITVGTSFEIGLSWVLPALSRLAQTMPQVTVHLYFGPAPDFLSRIKSMEIDAAITSFRLLDPAFASIQLLEERYVFVGAASLLDAEPLETPDQAARHTLLDIRSGLPMFKHVADAPACTSTIDFRAARYVGTTAAMRQVALDGGGVAVLPTYLVDRDLANGSLRRALPQIEPL